MVSLFLAWLERDGCTRHLVQRSVGQSFLIDAFAATLADLAMDDAGDARCIYAASFVLTAKLLTRKLEIRLDPEEDVLPTFHAQVGHVKDSAAPAVRLPHVNALADLSGKIDPLFELCSLEMRDGCSGNATVSVAHLLYSYHRTPPEKTLPSSCLDTCRSSLPATCPSSAARPLHSRYSSHLLQLHPDACACMDIAILAPLHHETLPKLQKLFSVCPAQTTPRLFSKSAMRSRPATYPSKIFPSSHLRACASSLSYTSVQPSHVVGGSLLSRQPPRVMLLHTQAMQDAYMIFVDLAILEPLHHVTLQKLQKLFECPTKIRFWLFSKPSMPLLLAAPPSKTLAPQLHACPSRLPWTCPQPSHGGSPLSSGPPCAILLRTEALQGASMDSAVLTPLPQEALPKSQKLPSRRTAPWLLRKPMPSRVAKCPSPSFSQLRASAGSLLQSSRPPHAILLHTEALHCASMDLVSLEPLHEIVPKLPKPSRFSPPLLVFSKRNMPLQLTAGPSKMVPSSRLDTDASILSFTSLQPSLIAEGSPLSSRLPQVMPLHPHALQPASMDLANLENLRPPPPRHAKVAEAALPHVLNMPLRIAARLSGLMPSSEMLACASGIHASAGAPTATGQGGRVGSVHWLCCLRQCLHVWSCLAWRGMTSWGLYPQFPPCVAAMVVGGWDRGLMKVPRGLADPLVGIFR